MKIIFNYSTFAFPLKVRIATTYWTHCMLDLFQGLPTYHELTEGRSYNKFVVGWDLSLDSRGPVFDLCATLPSVPFVGFTYGVPNIRNRVNKNLLTPETLHCYFFPSCLSKTYTNWKWKLKLWGTTYWWTGGG